MKTAVIRLIRVEAELRAKLEAVLLKHGETLTDFVESSLDKLQSKLDAKRKKLGR